MLEKIKNDPKLAELKGRYPNVNLIIIISAIIMVWRGVWGLLDKLLFPDSPILSYLISFSLGVLVLYLDDFKMENLKR